MEQNYKLMLGEKMNNVIDDLFISESKFNEQLISVIIPVYNVQRYLSRCIESIIGQSNKNWELILIDDGSTDKSGKICDKYALKDNRIKVIHKKNEGVSVARNIGINESKGEYITFVDSDDWISRDCFKTLYESIDSGKYDLVFSKLIGTAIRSVRQPITTNRSLEYDFEKSESVVSFFSEENNWRGPVAKLYKSNIIKNNDVLFPVGVTLGEDTIFVLDYLKHSKKVIQCNKHLYYYNRLLNSASDRYHADYQSYIQTIILKELALFGDLNNTSFNNQLIDEIFLYMSYVVKSNSLQLFYEAMENLVTFIVKLGFSFEDLYETIKSQESDDKIRLFEYLVNSDFDGLYNYYKIKKDRKFIGHIKSFIKSFLGNIKKIIVFDLKIGYWN